MQNLAKLGMASADARSRDRDHRLNLRLGQTLLESAGSNHSRGSKQDDVHG
jgi:hypothetical protein